ncbi:hypothetical protein B566_EDAN016455 [Ephemera danica]|nr:hypothetical protein B566_EDAN016455 [Ephemera danica]
MKLKLDVANAEIEEKDDVILQLRKEITRLKSAERHEPVASSESDLDKKSPTILKRLSGETKYLQNAFESAVKKIKVDDDAVTPTKSVPIEILVPETVDQYDWDDSTTVFNQGIIIPETVDMSMDGFPEPEHLELNERCSTPNEQNVSSTNPKSPVILTARAKKHSSLQISSPCLDISMTKLSPNKSLNCELKATNQLHSPSPKKLHPKKTEPVNPLMSSFKQPQCDINKNSPSKSSSVQKGQSSSASSVKRNFGKENKIEPKTDLGCKPSTSKDKQQQMAPITVKVKNLKGFSELEVRPTPKNFVAPKLRQTKLSLSMFKAKKTNVPQIDENQQLQMAIEESVKTAKQQDLEKMVISPSPDRLQSKKLSVDSNKTYFEGATALSFDNVDTTPQRQSIDLDKTYFEDAKSLQCENENNSPVQQTHDPDRTYFEDMKPTQQVAETAIKVPQSCELDKTYFEEARSILYGLGNSPKKQDIKQPPKLEPTDAPSSSSSGHLPVADKNYIQSYDR